MTQGRTALSIVKKYYPKVSRVVDAKRSVDIQITARDCKGATSKSPSTCAMAKAFCREYDGAVISIKRAYLVNGNIAYRYEVPGSVSREIVSFDRNHSFAPGQYWLNPVNEQAKLGVNGRLRDKKPDSRVTHQAKGVRKQSHRTAGIRAL